MDLFSEEKTLLQLPNAELLYLPHFFSKTEADAYFEILKATIAWQQDDIKVFGKIHAQPRLTALYAENETPYSYSNITMQPKPFTAELLAIKTKIEQEIQHRFSTVLLNLYRDGADSNGWHADNEKELGKNPVIASLSFGAVRPFHFKHRQIKAQRHKLDLEHGSLLVMRGEMQQYWLHQIAKTKKPIGSRINLTFRSLKE
ncbi:alpha-ketoglutarate-dependent dioxygenase AlkB [Subsaximicrobium wynnwilliamsii]|uniref:Alpha-ketoglutarate-dependent dioxygenase AlkB n=1 Tax=Subsaximicrobium wynnwilliamsii TaxID=291179 RepID=A0A5C6ZCN1_9FLAO|nr:alpha-ketoglutarate-dependent dioxygenase AlkB [Subsaximicrobium wynnwilliamsii]TXD81101.1 alpha-ketoglutarate-dependent dioxygenase AlkB [Subsaximicrobium wynnwilliamsii]TXD86775.1 alpha-ketoglutarate-dependent dioxygenase AlkB [Subsaximicrobium wynnwilliamsii]TXE00404.1 alpha-ketoglutarate-dependent dioxygenase AlkB [Subsaximicrobium wynnwilliamsii]